jgi:DNA-binding NarL/FixJ family response regulator
MAQRLDFGAPPMNPQLPVRLIVAHEHPIFRQGLKLLLEETRGLSVVGEAGDGQSAVDVIRRYEPDILLLDSTIPSGARETLRAVTEAASAVRTIVLTGCDEAAQLSLVESGARGLVPKQAPVAVLFASIQCVMEGEYWIGRDSMPNRADAVRHLTAARRANNPNARYRLTRREMQIVAAVTDGESNKGIAERLSVSEDTVKHHLSNVFNKLGVFSRLELAMFAINHGLVGDDSTLVR